MRLSRKAYRMAAIVRIRQVLVALIVVLIVPLAIGAQPFGVSSRIAGAPQAAAAIQLALSIPFSPLRCALSHGCSTGARAGGNHLDSIPLGRCAAAYAKEETTC